MDMEVKYHKYVPEKSVIHEAGDTFLMSDFVRLIRTPTHSFSITAVYRDEWSASPAKDSLYPFNRSLGGLQTKSGHCKEKSIAVPDVFT